MDSESEFRPGINLESLDTIVQRVIKEIRGRGSEPELPTGLKALDNAIWGLHRKELCVISARPGEGKTSMGLQIARNLVAHDKKVLFLSFEMTKEQLVERFLVQMTQADAWDLRVGRNVENFVSKVNEHSEFFKSANLRIMDDIGRTPTELKHVMNKVDDLTGSCPDVLILDFIQQIRGEGDMKKHEAVEMYLQTLKDLGKEFNMANLILSQNNRESVKGKKTTPSLEHMKDSASLEELADCVLMPWWEELGTEEKPEGMKYWICIPKQRYGTPGQRIPVKFIKEILTFTDVEDTVDKWTPTGNPDADRVAQFFDASKSIENNFP